MTTKPYYFYRAGSIPGIPGIFAGVVVEIDEERQEILRITPLGQALPALSPSIPLEAEPSPVIPESSKES